jgi:peptidoglycan/LPS O-acetylase OafA/YrhL
LRGLAAIVVLLCHLVQIFLQRLLGSNSVAVLVAGNLARHAVLVFFLLSGYLITQSIVANLERNGRLDCVEYLASRIARIYPPLVGTILVVLAVWMAIHVFDLPGGRRPYGLPGDLYAVREAYIVGYKDVILALLMQNGLLEADGPLWSLYMEFHLYLIAMFVAMMVGGRRRALWSVVAALLLVRWVRIEPSFAFFTAVWALGASVMLTKSQLIRPVGARFTKSIIYTVVATLLGMAWLAPRSLSIDYPNQWVAYAVQIGFCLVYADLMFLRENWLARPPNALVKTGGMSYSLYVLHAPLLLFILSITQTWVGMSFAHAVTVAVVAVVPVIAAAAWFARFFEDQRRFKPYIKAVLKAILPATRAVTVVDHG